MSTLLLISPAVNPPIVNPLRDDRDLADRIGLDADGGDSDGDSNDCFILSPELEAEYLGFQLGAEGIAAELPSPNSAERVAFERGHNAGDDYLWRVDPLFAAHLKERAELFAFETAFSGF